MKAGLVVQVWLVVQVGRACSKDSAGRADRAGSAGSPASR